MKICIISGTVAAISGCFALGILAVYLSEKHRIGKCTKHSPGTYHHSMNKGHRMDPAVFFTYCRNGSEVTGFTDLTQRSDWSLSAEPGTPCSIWYNPDKEDFIEADEPESIIRGKKKALNKTAKIFFASVLVLLASIILNSVF